MTSFLDFFQVSLQTVTSKKKELISIDSSKSIFETVALLQESKVSCVAVTQSPTKCNHLATTCDETKIYIGIVSMSDIALFLLDKSKAFTTTLGECESISNCIHHPIYRVIGCTQESATYIGFSIDREDCPLSGIVDKFCQGHILIVWLS
jgi:hypothetical protein